MIGWTSKAAGLLAGLGVLAMAGLITFDVLMRYFLDRPQLFVDELASFLQVFVVFAGPFLHTHHYVAVHLKESSIRIPGKSRVVRFPRDDRDYFIVHAEI